MKRIAAAVAVALTVAACGGEPTLTAPDSSISSPAPGSEAYWTEQFSGELSFMCGYSRTTILREAEGLPAPLEPLPFVLAWEACQ